ncbi:hypothetical protein [Streptomyces sp. NPDC005078]|uniref:hypothetical protein n=1 Tax=unclassified Streptomyces TaxID=2593676 RepID=UPI0033BE2D7D
MYAPIVIHAITLTGVRVVTINEELAAIVYSDDDLIEILRRAGIQEAECCLDDPNWIEWRGGRAHHYESADSGSPPPAQGPGGAERYER